MKYFLFLYSFLVASAAELPANPIPWDKLEMIGMGCPGGDGPKTLDPAKQGLLHISLAQFDMHKGQKRKACQLVMPISIPADQKLEVSEFNLTGQTNIVGSEAYRARAELFLAKESKKGSQAEEIRIDHTGPFALTKPTQVLGGCGMKDNFRISMSLFAEGTKSAARFTELSFRLRLLPCKP